MLVQWFKRNTKEQAEALRAQLLKGGDWQPLNEAQLICGAWSFKARSTRQFHDEGGY